MATKHKSFSAQTKSDDAIDAAADVINLAAPPERHSKLLWSLATFALLDVGMNLLAGFDLSMIDQVDGSSYPFNSVVWDLAALSCLRALVVFLVVWTYSAANSSGSKSHALPSILAGNQPLITNSQEPTAPPSFRFRSRNLSARVAANVLLVVALFDSFELVVGLKLIHLNS